MRRDFDLVSPQLLARGRDRRIEQRFGYDELPWISYVGMGGEQAALINLSAGGALLRMSSRPEHRFLQRADPVVARQARLTLEVGSLHQVHALGRVIRCVPMTTSASPQYEIAFLFDDKAARDEGILERLELPRQLGRPAALVGPPRGERVVAVGDGHDPAPDGYPAPLPLLGIPGPVPALVVGQRHFRGESQQLGGAPAQDPVPDHGVLLHDLVLGFVERTRLEQDMVRNSDLSHVVHGRCPEHELLFGFRHAQLSCGDTRIPGHPHDVTSGLPVPVLGGPEGHAADVLAAAHEKWSLSPLTLPHMLVRLVVAEQIYRAAAMLANHPYHRA